MLLRFDFPRRCVDRNLFGMDTERLERVQTFDGASYVYAQMRTILCTDRHDKHRLDDL